MFAGWDLYDATLGYHDHNEQQLKGLNNLAAL